MHSQHWRGRAANGGLTMVAAMVLAGCQSVAPPSPPPSSSAVPAAAYVDALQSVFGKHPGARGSHAKGVCASGTFTATGDAAAVTRAGFLQPGASVPVVARFSVGGGNPSASDKGKVRGLALHLQGAGSEATDLVAASAPMFFIGRIEHFIPFLEARRPDPTTGKPDPAKVKAFNDSHPDAQPQIAYLAAAPVYTSYATTPYWPASAFRFTNAAGQTVHAKWRLEPSASRQAMSAEQLQAAGDNFLADELQRRLSTAPVGFDVFLQLADAGDNTTDPSVQWPDSRRQIRAGHLALTKFDGQACDTRMFNPLTLAAGIAPSDDSTLRVRSAVYAESLRRRLAR